MIWILILIISIAIIVLVLFFQWKKNGLKVEPLKYGTSILKSEITNNTMGDVLYIKNKKITNKTKDSYEDLV